MLGPLDYVIVGFDGNNFDGSIADALSEAINKNIIRVVDLIFIIKDKDGKIVDGEYEDQSADLVASFGDFRREDDMPLISDSDIDHIGSEMKNDSAVAAFVIEHVWAKNLKKAISNAGGFLLDRGRIDEAVVDMVMNDLEKTAANKKTRAKS